MDRNRMQSTNTELADTSGKKTFSDVSIKPATLQTQRSDIFRRKSEKALNNLQGVF